MAATKLEKKVKELEGLVLANRFGAKTIWSGFMTTVISTLVLVVVFLPVAFWAGSYAEKQADGSVALASDGATAAMIAIVVVVVCYVVMLIGMIRILMGFYRMAHPEKYVDRLVEEE